MCFLPSTTVLVRTVLVITGSTFICLRIINSLAYTPPYVLLNSLASLLANLVVEIIGNGLTIALNSINNQIWTVVNTGTDATWIEIDTAA